MLEIKNLKKTYRSKKGGDTEALKGVSLKFADTGLVFILGKSGCGKSTLLNMLGGLDSFDSGEIVVNGKSSASFSSSDFDSYRNTYLGFVFQEFNIIESFTIEKNISLAMQLQDKKADSNSVADILKEVDLVGFEKRKPNELSGGQKQRVAIARALIKDPEIILADEPTGALDSSTGKSVMKMLKNLSRKKLVIIVSHDRDFAEIYGDRIVELSDGLVVADRTRTESGALEDTATEIIAVEDNILRIPKGKILDEEAILQINKALSSSETDLFLTLSTDEKVEKAYPQTMQKIREEGLTSKAVFEQTNEENITTDRPSINLIKSKLPIADAFKIGVSNFKSKKFRLVLTVVLSIFSLLFFGFADIFASYNKAETYANAFYTGDAYYMNVEKTYKFTYPGSNMERDERVNFTSEDVNYITERFNENVLKVYSFEDYRTDANFFKASEDALFAPRGYDGFLETKQNDDIVAYGKFPSNFNEIMISDYMAKGYVDFSVGVQSLNGIKEYVFDSYDQVLGHTIKIDGKDYTISGIFKTNFNFYYDTLSVYSEQELYNNDEAKRHNDNYSTDKNLFYGKVIVKEGFSENRKQAMTSFMANLVVEVPSLNEHQWFEPLSIAVDDSLKQGEIKLPLWYYRDFKYGYDNQITNEEIYGEFNVPQSISAFIPIMQYFPEGERLFETTYQLVGVYEENYGGGMVPMGKDMAMSIDYDVAYGGGNGNQVLVSPADFDFLVDNFYVPESILIDARMSGGDLLSTITSLQDENYQVTARNIYELQMVDNLMDTLLVVFYIIAGVLAFFVMLLLYNFISASILNKKKEIGILRAIGARGVDIGSIFIFESLIIGGIILVVSIPLVIILSGVLQNLLLTSIPIQIIKFGLRQVFTMTGITVAIMVVSSLIPVLKISKRKPIEAILDK